MGTEQGADTGNSTSLTVSDVAAIFEGQMEADTGQSTAPKKPPQREVEAKANPEEEAESQSETEDEDAETEATEEEAEEEGSEEEDEANAEDGPQDPLPLDAKVTVKVDGTDIEVTLEEAIKGYQRTADYQRKTGALAEARRAFMAEVQQVRTERAQYSALLDTLAKQTDEAVKTGEPDWEYLRHNDPLEFAIKREEWREKAEKRAAIHAEQSRLQAIQAQEQVSTLREFIQNEGQKLVQDIPEFRDPKQRATTQKALRDYGLSIGWTEAELDQAYDSRAVKALYKAMKYDQMLAKQPAKPGQVVRTVPKVPLRAGSANTPPKRQTELTRAKASLRKTGSVRDLATVFEKLI